MIYLLSPVSKENICHLPMIEFALLDVQIDFSGYNILMFTSKQAVKSIEQLNPKWKELPCLAIGTATAREIVNLGGRVIYKPESFYGEKLGSDIIQNFSIKKSCIYVPKKYFLM